MKFRCAAKSKRSGKQCRRDARAGEFCTQHNAIQGRDDLVLSDQHATQCSVCQHPEKDRIVDQWLDWSRGAVSLCREFGISNDSFYRHVNYYGLHDKRVNGMLTFCSIGIGKALRSGNARLSDAAALGNLALKFIQGGEVVKLQIRSEMEQDLVRRDGSWSHESGGTVGRQRRCYQAPDSCLPLST